MKKILAGVLTSIVLVPAYSLILDGEPTGNPHCNEKSSCLLTLSSTLAPTLLINEADVNLDDDELISSLIEEAEENNLQGQSLNKVANHLDISNEDLLEGILDLMEEGDISKDSLLQRFAN